MAMPVQGGLATPVPEGPKMLALAGARMPVPEGPGTQAPEGLNTPAPMPVPEGPGTQAPVAGLTLVLEGPHILDLVVVGASLPTVVDLGSISTRGQEAPARGRRPISHNANIGASGGCAVFRRGRERHDAGGDRAAACPPTPSRRSGSRPGPMFRRRADTATLAAKTNMEPDIASR
jgi:hypothetical protein